jgi:hypothetical protein
VQFNWRSVRATVATTTNAANIDLVKRSADIVIDYKRTISESHAFDVVLDAGRRTLGKSVMY